jgi:hypothetical protein
MGYIISETFLVLLSKIYKTRFINGEMLKENEHRISVRAFYCITIHNTILRAPGNLQRKVYNVRLDRSRVIKIGTTRNYLKT